MEYLNTAQELLDFIMRCKSPFHVVKEAGDLLNENGYTKLEETKEWSLVPGGKYFLRSRPDCKAAGTSSSGRGV